jgi:hypothetical protein
VFVDESSFAEAHACLFSCAIGRFLGVVVNVEVFMQIGGIMQSRDWAREWARLFTCEVEMDDHCLQS